jgi:mannose-6-phosphate isomerase-like protein (cupin superfamily)
MTTDSKVQALNINHLTRYSSEARVNQLLLTSNDFVTRMSSYESGQVTLMHTHPNDDEVLFCVEGRGSIALGDRDDVAISAGSLVSVPAGGTRGIHAALDSRLIVICTTDTGYTTIRPESQDTSIPLPSERK